MFFILNLLMLACSAIYWTLFAKYFLNFKRSAELERDFFAKFSAQNQAMELFEKGELARDSLLAKIYTDLAEMAAKSDLRRNFNDSTTAKKFSCGELYGLMEYRYPELNTGSPWQRLLYLRLLLSGILCFASLGIFFTLQRLVLAQISSSYVSFWGLISICLFFIAFAAYIYLTALEKNFASDLRQRVFYLVHLLRNSI